MRVKLFVADGQASLYPGGHVLVIADEPEAARPPHPDGKAWRYFATTTTADRLLRAVRIEIEVAVSAGGYFIFGKTADPSADNQAASNSRSVEPISSP